MSKLLCNVLKISGGENAPNAPPGCAPGLFQHIVVTTRTSTLPPLMSGS